MIDCFRGKLKCIFSAVCLPVSGELTEMEEPARRKTRKQEEGDDDNALRSWPPPRPQPGAVSRGGEGLSIIY